MSQKTLVQHAQSLGYISSVSGVCAGVSGMAVQAILADDLKTFDRRLNKILSTPVGELPQQIKLAKEKYIQLVATAKEATYKSLGNEINLFKTKQNTAVISDAEKKSLNVSFQRMLNSSIQSNVDNALKNNNQVELDIPNFYEGIELYFQPRKYDPIKTLPLSNQFPLALPEKLEKNGGIEQQTLFTDVYKKNELITYLNLLRKVLISASLPIAFSLKSSTHQITIGYDIKTQQWALIDANVLPTIYFQDDAELAESIIAAFSFNKITAFATEINILKNHSDAIKPHITTLFQQLKLNGLLKVTPEKAALVDSYGGSWLFVAAEAGNLELVAELLNQGANPNQNCDCRASILMIAAKNGFDAIIKLLLEKKADPNFVEKSQNATALYMAAQNGHLETVKILLKYKADPDFALTNGNSPLIWAAIKGNFDIAKELLQSKAKLMQANGNGDFPLFFAAQNGFVNVVDLLISNGADINQRNKKGVTALMQAVIAGKLDVIRDLLSKGADITLTRYADGANALMVAQKMGRTDIVAILLEKKNDNNINPHPTP